MTSIRVSNQLAGCVGMAETIGANFTTPVFVKLCLMATVLMTFTLLRDHRGIEKVKQLRVFTPQVLIQFCFNLVWL